MKWQDDSAPDGRYGHTMNIILTNIAYFGGQRNEDGTYGRTINVLSTKIVVFGGQRDGVFFNDMKAFDLDQLENSQSAWKSWPPHSSKSTIPDARSNLSMVSSDDQLYL